MKDQDYFHCQPYNPLKHNLTEDERAAIAAKDPNDPLLFNRECPNREGVTLEYRPLSQCQAQPSKQEQKLRKLGYKWSEKTFFRLIVLLLSLLMLMQGFTAYLELKYLF